MTKEICLCVHGHFYQPPRENPWTGEVELQESAAPYHDWNERIHHECYLPNTKAKVLDEQGNLVKTVNNFEKISFNIGPTLKLIFSKLLTVFTKFPCSSRTFAFVLGR